MQISRDSLAPLRRRPERRSVAWRRSPVGAFFLLAGVSAVALLGAGCGQSSPPGAALPNREGQAGRIATSVFGVLPDGREVPAATLRNGTGLEVEVIAYGAILRAIRTPDRNASLGDIVLGFDDLDGYLGNSPYFGAVVGRYANRIAGGRFELDGVGYELARNNGPNHLHGGVRGFDKVLWTLRTVAGSDRAAALLEYVSPAGEEGYPGQLTVQVTYTLTDGDELLIAYRAVSDAPTPVNLSQHTYFDLSAGESADVLGHELLLHADSLTPVDETLIPTGEIAAVAATPFDFTTPRTIGERIRESHPQLLHGGGYDHNFVLRRPVAPRPSSDAAGATHAARVRDPVSGRTLDIFTTEPGIQFYSGNFLDGTLIGKEGRVYGRRSGFCLETQHYPDSPNRPGFPNTVLRPGEEYQSLTVWQFSADPRF
jgi:aldose 1-epimerase